MIKQTEFLVIGTGLAGLATALELADHLASGRIKTEADGKVTVLAKKKAQQNNTRWAQGGIAAVTADEDSFQYHIQDTLYAGAGLCHEDTVKLVVEEGPGRIQAL